MSVGSYESKKGYKGVLVEKARMPGIRSKLQCSTCKNGSLDSTSEPCWKCLDDGKYSGWQPVIKHSEEDKKGKEANG